jgi:hypothetical protein
VPQTLIISEVAIDSNRRDEDRDIVRKRINSCVGQPINTNPYAINNIIYFIDEQADSDYSRLVSRSVAPTYNKCSVDRDTGFACIPASATCLDNSRKTSCPAGTVATTPDCSKEDTVLSENIVDFRVRYFQEDNIETSFPSSADQIEMVLVLGDRVFGREVEVEVSHRIRKIN